MPPQAPMGAPIPQPHGGRAVRIVLVIGAAIIVIMLIIAALAFALLPRKTAPQPQSAATTTPQAPQATLGGSLYTQAAAEQNPLKSAPKANAFTQAANPFDAAYQNPFAQ